MSSKRIGRPSQAIQRRREILAAAAKPIAALGIEATSLSDVADAAGMTRTLVTHYFGSRDKLIDAFITEVVHAYGEQMLLVGGGDTASAIHHLTSDDAYRSSDDLAIWLDMVAVAARRPDVREHVQALWTRTWLPLCERGLAADYPDAGPARIRQVAFCLTCLIEAYWALRAQGVGDSLERRDDVREGCRVLLCTLTE